MSERLFLGGERRHILSIGSFIAISKQRFLQLNFSLRRVWRVFAESAHDSVDQENCVSKLGDSNANFPTPFIIRGKTRQFSN